MPTTRRAATVLVGVLVGVLAALLPLLGAATPAGARVGTRAVVAPVSSAATGRVADRAARPVARQAGHRLTGERVKGERVARPGLTKRAVRVPFHPSAPATCGADPTGPPSTWSRVLAARAVSRASRRTPVGAGRSPPAFCGR